MSGCASAIPLVVALAMVLASARRSEAEDSFEESAITSSEREHWAYQPLSKPALPTVPSSSWCRNPIDVFILSDLQDAGASPAQQADYATLVRRTWFSLVGLPPSQSDLQVPEDGDVDAAYARMVERLLGSPEYGKHQAQGWLDLARWAETDGFEHDKTRAIAWKYRDWVIDAINDDPGYDDFVRMQIAGDVFDPEQAIATAFCLSGPDMPDINLQQERRDFLLNDITATVGAVFLGMQTGCAQCHDHKFDPISQVDFYRLRGVFDHDVQVVKNKSVGHLVANRSSAPANRLMIRGDFRRPGPEVPAGFPRIANLTGASIAPGADGQQRREALAQWLTNPNHPLVARVMVNRIWQQHFGSPLSESPNDFGLMGSEPSPRALLDWLATQFIRHRWSRKWLDRLIVSSATFRQSSVAAGNGVDDADLWDHYRRRRLTGEQIRDAMLVASQQLSGVSGGPSVRPPLPKEMVATLLNGHWKTSEKPEQHHRRSVYIFARRNLRFPIFDVFDRPTGQASCAARNESTTAVQSLSMLNSDFTDKTATAVVELAKRTGGIESERLPLAVGLASRIARQIVPHSRSMIQAACQIAEQEIGPSASQDQRDAVLQDLAIALFNSNAFLYVD